MLSYPTLPQQAACAGPQLRYSEGHLCACLQSHPRLPGQHKISRKISQTCICTSSDHVTPSRSLCTVSHLGDLIRDAVVQGSSHSQVHTVPVELRRHLSQQEGTEVLLHIGWGHLGL